jgi:hypothetical protein
MITLNTTIRTANELQWNICSLPHSGEHIQVAYTLSLDGAVIEQDIKTLEGVIVDGSVSLTAITDALITALND